MIWQYRLAHCCSRRGIVMDTSGLPDMLACGVNSWRFSAEGVGTPSSEGFRSRPRASNASSGGVQWVWGCRETEKSNSQ
jgi:hypothetical protein